MTDYYALLRIPRTAAPAEIKQAYRRMAVLLHPDKNPHPEATDGFRAVTEAWEVLGDPFKRALYDKLLNEEATVQPVYHRDPAYRRAPGQRPVPRPDPNAALLRRLYGYSLYVVWVAALFTILLLTDFLLPEKILQDEIVRDQRTLQHHILYTKEGHQFNVMFPQNKLFHRDPEIRVQVSPLLGFLKGIETQSGYTFDNYPSLYLNFFFLPLLTGGLSFISLLFIRKEGEARFNMAVALLMLMLLNLVFFAWSTW
jgi:curved DNA-binding protein CbpA